MGSGFVDLTSKRIPPNEDPWNEFKEFYEYRSQFGLDEPGWNRRSPTVNAQRAESRKQVAKAVCAMGNGEGGFVYLGVRNDGVPVGLEKDMQLLGFTNYEDLLANHISNSLKSLIKNKLFFVRKIRIGFSGIGSITICIIQIRPSDTPLFLHGPKGKEFYVRGPAPCNERLNEEETDEYITDRFGTGSDEGKDIRQGSDVVQEMNRISAGTVRSIPGTIRDTTISLQDRVSEMEKALDERGRVAVTGEKGSGKSVLLCHAYERLAKKRPVFFVRCDHHLDAESFDGLDKSMIPGRSFVEALYDASRQTEPVVIFDSIDAVSRNKKAMNALQHMLKNIWGNDRIQTIVSVRSYDYEYSPIISTTDWGQEYALKPLADSELDRVLKDLGSPNVPDRLKTLLHNPFRLNLLSLILENAPNADFAEIRREADLYDMHWHECVEKESDSDARDMLYSVSQKMTELQRVSIPYEDFGNRDLMGQICSKNILVRKPGLLWFFHHAYLDYVMSRFIIERKDVVGFISSDEYNVFLRPTLVFTMSLLHKRDPARFVRTIEQMLQSGLKHFWKTSALTALAQVPGLGGQDFSNIGRLLTGEKMLQRHFLMEAERQKSRLWFELWQGTFFAEWVSDPGANAYFLLGYLRSIKDGVDDGQIFSVVRKIVSSMGDVHAQRKAVGLAAELEADGRTEWMSEMAASEHAHVRAGVAESLPKLLDACPKAVPGIFCSLFTYKETSREKNRRRGARHVQPYEQPTAGQHDGRLAAGPKVPVIAETKPRADGARRDTVV